MLVAIDPGYEKSGWISLDNSGEVDCATILDNEETLEWIYILDQGTRVVIEAMWPYGIRPGIETYETLRWSGRFEEGAYLSTQVDPGRLYRKDIKVHFCGVVRANDSDVWVAITNRYGGKTKAVGTKKNPGPLYGVKSHCRAALAVALAWQDGLRCPSLVPVSP